ncbi:unnamed protein product [Alopecurus aequalis]
MDTLAVSLPPAPFHHGQVNTPAFHPLPPAPAARASFPRPTHRVVALVQWSGPHPGWHKLNFDGSVHHDGSGRASIGGVLRDCYGHAILAFGEKTQHAGVGVVEARALIRGLHLALQIGIDRLVVEGDDLTLVRLLRGESAHTRIPWAMYDDIIKLLCCFQDVEVLHVYREGNQVADQLCHEAYRCPGVWTDQLPVAVWDKIEEDRCGVVHPRIRPV